MRIHISVQTCRAVTLLAVLLHGQLWPTRAWYKCLEQRELNRGCVDENQSVLCLRFLIHIDQICMTACMAYSTAVKALIELLFHLYLGPAYYLCPVITPGNRRNGTTASASALLPGCAGCRCGAGHTRSLCICAVMVHRHPGACSWRYRGGPGKMDAAGIPRVGMGTAGCLPAI